MHACTIPLKLTTEKPFYLSHAPHAINEKKKNRKINHKLTRNFANPSETKHH